VFAMTGVYYIFCLTKVWIVIIIRLACRLARIVERTVRRYNIISSSPPFDRISNNNNKQTIQNRGAQRWSAYSIIIIIIKVMHARRNP